MSKLLPVENCFQCDYMYLSHTKIGQICKCRKTRRRISKNIIPDWCPLEDARMCEQIERIINELAMLNKNLEEYKLNSETSFISIGEEINNLWNR